MRHPAPAPTDDRRVSLPMRAVARGVYAPPPHVPRSVAFPTSPVSADAVMLITGYILPEFRGGGLGRVLVQTVAKDLIKRGGIRAIEAFGRAEGADLAKSETGRCVVPADYLTAVGFKTVRPHHRWPRLRLELRTALSWKSDVEYALEKLLGSMSPNLTLGTAHRTPAGEPG